MAKRMFMMLLLSLFLCGCATRVPMNLGLEKKALVAYHDSGNYAQDISAETKKGIACLKKATLKNNLATDKKKLAMVLDIDETALSEYDFMIATDFSSAKNVLEGRKAWTFSAVPQTLELYNYAKANGVAVFFLSGRRENWRDGTEKNLMQAGYKDWDGLYLKADDYSGSTLVFKTNIRKEIIAKGYDIVLNVGDQDQDLIGGYADYGLRLPNPYYLSP